MHGIGLTDAFPLSSTVVFAQPNASAVNTRRNIAARVVEATRTQLQLEFDSLDQSNFDSNGALGDDAVYAWMFLQTEAETCFDGAFASSFTNGYRGPDSACTACYQTPSTQLFAGVVAADPVLQDSVVTMASTNLTLIADQCTSNVTAVAGGVNLCLLECCTVLDRPEFALVLAASGLPNDASSANVTVDLEIPSLQAWSARVNSEVRFHSRRQVELIATLNDTVAAALFSNMSMDEAFPAANLTATVSFTIGPSSASLQS